MKKISKLKTEEYIRSVALPTQTESYTVISHSFIIDKIRNILNKEGFNIQKELYMAQDNGEVAMGFMILETTTDPDMTMTFNWTNSYNKKLRFSCSIGGYIYDNEVQFITSNESIYWFRKHTGTALEETDQVIEQIIQNANNHFNEMIKMKDMFININVSKKDFGRHLGALYFEKNILSPDVASKIKKEYYKPSKNYTHKDTLWGLYKIIAGVTKDSNPLTWYKSQIQVHDYFYLESQINALNTNGIPVVETKIPELQININVDTTPQLELFTDQVEEQPKEVEIEPDDYIIEESNSIIENEDEVLEEHMTVEDVIETVESVVEEEKEKESTIEIVTENNEVNEILFPTEDIHEEVLYENDTIEEVLSEEIIEEEINIIEQVSHAFLSEELINATNKHLETYYNTDELKLNIADCNIEELNNSYLLSIKRTNELFEIEK